MEQIETLEAEAAELTREERALRREALAAGIKADVATFETLSVQADRALAEATVKRATAFLLRSRGGGSRIFKGTPNDEIQ